MKNATLRQLKVFECVGRHLSFTRAARELHLSQPAVSAQVKQLEEHTGLPLFEKLGRHVFLTPAGTRMLGHSRAIIEQFREAGDSMLEMKGVAGGKLVVTVISAGDYFFPHVLVAFGHSCEGPPRARIAPPPGAASVGVRSPEGPPRGTAAPPRGAASEASVGVRSPEGPPRGIAAPPRGAASEASVGVEYHRGVTFELRVANREGLLRQIAENQTDLGVMGRAPRDRDMVAEAFAPHPYVVVAPPGHPLAAKRRIAPSLLLREAFVVREVGSDTARAMAKCFGASMPRLRVAMEIGSNETIKQAVTAGMGIAFLSAHAVALELQVGRLVALDVRGFPHMESWYVVHRRGKRLPPVAGAFKEFLRTNGSAVLESFVHGRTTPGKRNVR